jgi:hypothetical protein
MSASPGVRDGHGYTSFGFANPIRKVLGAVLLTRGQLNEVGASPGDQGRAGGARLISSLVPSGTEPAARAARIQFDYVVDVVDVVERYLYRPLIPLGRYVVRTAKRLQSGRLDAYIGYMLVAVLAVLAVVTALAGS